MQTRIIRGKNQIGGNIIEISTEKTKILLDAGLELDDEKNKELPDVPGLFDYAGYDAVFVSHYHGDHVGLVYDIHKDIPVYIGEKSHNILKFSNEFLNRKQLNPKGFLYHKKDIVIGDITVTPFLCDHSAFDSYMLLCRSGDESVLYTGDFRSNGRKSFDMLLNALPKKVDRLICEGTTFSREGYVAETEATLEDRAEKVFKEHKGPAFILQSSMNIDRLVTMYRASKKAKRVFLEDAYLANIAETAGERIPNPKFYDVYAFPMDSRHYKYIEKYGNKIGKDKISENHFSMCVRTSMISYLKDLSKKMSFEDGVLIYSFWSGYKETETMKEFLSECENLGLKIETIHTSGHADEQAVKTFIETVNPKVITPVHTENAEKFKELAPGIPIEI